MSKSILKSAPLSKQAPSNAQKNNENAQRFNNIAIENVNEAPLEEKKRINQKQDLQDDFFQEIMTPNSQLSSYKNEILKSSLIKSNKAVSPMKIDEFNIQKEKEDLLQI